MGRRLLSIVACIVLLAMLVAWPATAYRAVLFEFFTPAGHVQVIAFEHSGLVLFLSDIPFGQDMGFKTDVQTIPTGDGNAMDGTLIHEVIFDPRSTERWRRFGIHWATDTAQMSSRHAWRWGALLVPYWELIAIQALVTASVFYRGIARRRRRKQGQCIHCGYDLRHSAERCSECGAAILPERRKRSFKLLQHPFQSTPFLIVVILLALALLIWPSSPTQAEIEARRFHAAKLDVDVPEFAAVRMPITQAFKQLEAMTGAHIAFNPIARQMSLNWFAWSGPQLLRAHVTGTFHHVSLATIMKLFMEEIDFESSNQLAFEPQSDGSIFVGAKDEMERYVQIYNLRPQSTLIQVDDGLHGASPLVQLLNGEESHYVDGRLVLIGTLRDHAKVKTLVEQFHQIREPWPSDVPLALRWMGSR